MSTRRQPCSPGRIRPRRTLSRSCRRRSRVCGGKAVSRLWGLKHEEEGKGERGKKKKKNVPSAIDKNFRGLEDAETPGFAARCRCAGGKGGVEEGGRRHKGCESIGVGLHVPWLWLVRRMAASPTSNLRAFGLDRTHEDILRIG